MILCPDCGSDLEFMVIDDKEDSTYTHIYEMCVHCGFTKSYVDYEDEQQ